MATNAAGDFGFAPQSRADKLGIVSIVSRRIRAQGGDPRTGEQYDVNFDPGVFEGSAACIKVADRAIVETWVRHLGAVLKEIPYNLAYRLAEKAREYDDLPRAWVEVLRMPWPGDAASNDESYEKLKLIESLRKRFYDVDPNWPLEKLRAYAARPELIYADRAAAMGVASDGGSVEHIANAAPRVDDTDMVNEFLRSGN